MNILEKLTKNPPNRNKLYAKVLELFAKYDPEGLIKMGAPRDEYAPELDYILRMMKAKKKKFTFKFFEQVFNDMFGCNRKGTNSFSNTRNRRLVELYAELIHFNLSR